MTGATSALVVLFASCRRILGPSRDLRLNLANLGGRHPTKCPPAWKPIFLLCARPGSPISQSHPPGGLIHCHCLLSNLCESKYVSGEPPDLSVTGKLKNHPNTPLFWLE